MSMTTLLKRNPKPANPKPGASPATKKKDDEERDRPEEIKEEEASSFEEKKDEEKKDEKGRWRNQRIQRINLGENDIKSLEELKKRLDDESKHKREEGLEQLNKSFEDKQPEPLKVFNPPVWTSFSQTLNYFRLINIPVPHPQVCLIARPNKERFDLIEAIIGFQLFGKIDYQTTRVIKVLLTHDPEREEPEILIGSEHEEFQEYTTELLEEEIDKKETPFYIQISSKYLFNIDIIVLAFTDNVNEQKNIQKYTRPKENPLIYVEAELGTERSPENFKKIDFLQKIDPTFSRLVFVHANFRRHLVTFPLKEDIDKYLSSVVTLGTYAKNFFVTLSNVVHKDKSMFVTHLTTSQNSDMNLLKSLNFSIKYTNYIGIFAFRQYFYEKIWDHYKTVFPKLMEQLKINKYKQENLIQQLEGSMHKTIDLYRLKKEGSDYLGQTLSEISTLVSGSVDGSPQIHGQTLEQEMNEGDLEDWVDSNGRYLPVKGQEWGIPHITSALYGGQQFERLVMEFHAVASHVNPSNPTNYELSNSYSPRMNSIWAATDIAQKKIRQSFEPLIRILVKRAEYILNRLLDLQKSQAAASSNSNEFVIQSTRNNPSTVQSTLPPLVKIYDMKTHPFFLRKISQLYYEFNNQNAESCLEDCFDEFYSTETIYWELINFSMDSLEAEMKSTSNQTDALEGVRHLTNHIFFKIRKRLIENVIVKLYNHLLVPLKTGAWSGIHKQLSVMTENELEELFELSAIRREMQDHRAKLHEQHMNLEIWQFLLQNCARVFSTSHSPKRW